MDAKNKLAKASHSLTSSDSSISATIMQKEIKGMSYVMWSDQPPTKASSAAPTAHSKGLLIFTSSGGLWLTHSLPKFPVANASSASDLWAQASDKFGQSYLCINVVPEDIRELVSMFKITRPTIYEAKIVGTESIFPDLKPWEKLVMTTEITISSKGGQKFDVYGKAGKWGKGKDLYRDLVAPSIGKLHMEGWRRGKGVWGPACGEDEVLDITSVSFPEADWSTTNDHSKWAVGQTKNVFCVGDINRADGQDLRGGKTVCIQSSLFAEQMRKVINTADSCNSVVMV